jgi:hypothetical protein
MHVASVNKHAISKCGVCGHKGPKGFNNRCSACTAECPDTEEAITKTVKDASWEDVLKSLEDARLSGQSHAIVDCAGCGNISNERVQEAMVCSVVQHWVLSQCALSVPMINSLTEI